MTNLTTMHRKDTKKARSTGTFQLSHLSQSLKRLFPGFTWSWAACIPLVWILWCIFQGAVQAQSTEEPITPESVQAALDNIWVLIASILVIFMNAGFAMLETGFCRQKNAVNILSKNLIVFALAVMAYWATGFALMYGGNGPFVGGAGFFLTGIQETYNVPGNLTVPVFFLFQVAFAGTAATIVSGAVAERIKFIDFIIFSLLLTGITYPICGHWVWGGGMLSDIGFLETGFIDFAGSTIVHSIGGWSALIGAAMLGPRLGKYREDGTATALPGHNMSIATLGGLILWVGWFGFNPGSQLAADPVAVPYIAVITTLAGAAGGCSATLTSWLGTGKPDLSMIINGILAGLVSITAGCAASSYGGAVIVGGISGVLVVFAVVIIDTTFKIDDPVGAISVHLVNGIWGTIAVGLFDTTKGLFYGGGVNQLMAQILGSLTISGFTVLMSFIFWGILKSTLGLRVSPEEENIGLDIGEHGMEAYSDFLKDISGIGPFRSSKD